MATASILPLTQRPIFDRAFPSAECSMRLKCRQSHVCRLEKLSPDGGVGFDLVTSECSRTHPVNSRRRFVELGCGLLTTTLTMTMAAEAEEEKKEEESCELTFAPSGLGYCDIVVGTGIEPPQGELILVLSILYIYVSALNLNLHKRWFEVGTGTYKVYFLFSLDLVNLVKDMVGHVSSNYNSLRVPRNHYIALPHLAES